MGNPLGDFKVSGQCYISNYKPGATVEGEKVEPKNQFNIWFNNNDYETGGRISNRNIKNETSTKNYNSILTKLASLAGDKKSLEYCDILKLEEDKSVLFGKYGIRDIKVDVYGPNPSGSARFILDDGRQLRVDFKLSNEKDDPNSSARKTGIKQQELLIAEQEVKAKYGKQMAKIEQLRKDKDFNKYFDVEYEFKNDQFTGNVILKVKKSTSAVNTRRTAKLREGAIKDSTIIDKNNKKVNLADRGDVWFSICKGELDSKRLKEGDRIYLGINDFQ